MTDNFDRRDFLKMGLGILGCVMIPDELFAASAKLRKKLDVKSLEFFNLHTEEKLSVNFWMNGKYIKQGLRKINYILRDHRTNIVKPIDTKLLDLLFTIKKGLNVKEPFRIISGYRSPQSNENLSNNSTGVAKKSYHLKGMAIDISLDCMNIKKIRDYAMNLEKGGVGYYSESNFVHLDVGPVRHW